MNRDDLLKKCVDRGVADETSVGAVSHLFYVYLLSALQKGQRVEVPNFGTFGTRVVGVKRARKMPYFEVEQEVADQVNERYRQLKYLVVGKYDLVPAFGEEEYKGKDAPYDVLVEQIGREKVLDTHREVSVEEYEREAAAVRVPPPSKEKKLMPKLNLKGDEMDEMSTRTEPEQVTPVPSLRDIPEGKGPSPLVQVLLAVIILGAITFALNYFGVVHLWGKKTPQVTEALPEPSLPPPPVVEPKAEVTPTPTPTPTPVKPTPVPAAKPKVTAPATGTGDFTVQVSSWMSKSKADSEAERLAGGGFSAFVQDAVVSGEHWYRVRIGRYATQREAAEAAADLQTKLENGFWVARVGH